MRKLLPARWAPADALRFAGLDPGPFALSGSWSAGAAVVGSAPLIVARDPADPFALIERQPEITSGEGTVGGGWVGYLGYGLGRLIEKLPPPARRQVRLPGAILAFYDHVLVRDDEGRWWFEALWSKQRSAVLTERLSLWRRRAQEVPPEPAGFSTGAFALNPDAHSHLISVSRAIEHIRSGDVFQVNVCTRLEAAFSGSALELFCAGSERLAPRYGAFVGHRDFALACFSPELFLRRVGRRVVSSPIKGTIRCGTGQGAERDRLLASAKDRAENLMIVDLVRNDLGRVCSYGTVRVPDLYRPERHPGLWHLVSDVTGELPGDVSDGQLLKAAFPPGSVTGAPKVRAMELINTVEETSREAYTGAIGIVSPVSGLEFNVTIRTFEVSPPSIWLGAGGGIVADSDPVCELEECLDKARPLLRAVGARLEEGGESPSRAPVSRHVEAGLGVFETILVAEGRPVALEAHLGRLGASAALLYGRTLPAAVGSRAVERAAEWDGFGRMRIAIRPSQDGELCVETTISAAPEASNDSGGTPLVLVPFVLPGGLGAHKWQDRRALLQARSSLQLGELEQLLLVDEDGTVLETEQANVFAVLDGVLRTPPLDGRILPGTTRREVLWLAAHAGVDCDCAPLSLRELCGATEVFVSSAIRGVRCVRRLGEGVEFVSGWLGELVAKSLKQSRDAESRPL